MSETSANWKCANCGIERGPHHMKHCSTCASPSDTERALRVRIARLEGVTRDGVAITLGYLDNDQYGHARHALRALLDSIGGSS